MWEKRLGCRFLSLRFASLFALMPFCHLTNDRKKKSERERERKVTLTIFWHSQPCVYYSGSKYFSITIVHIHNILLIYIITTKSLMQSFLFSPPGLVPPSSSFDPGVITHTESVAPAGRGKGTTCIITGRAQKSGTYNEPHLRYTVTNDQRGRWQIHLKKEKGDEGPLAKWEKKIIREVLDIHKLAAYVHITQMLSNGYTALCFFLFPIRIYIHSKYHNNTNSVCDVLRTHWWQTRVNQQQLLFFWNIFQLGWLLS